MNALAWSLAWQTALARRRLLVLNVLIPLLLVVPIAFSEAPPHHAAAVYTVLFALFGAFGSAIPLLRESERGFTRRLTHTRVRAQALLLGRAAAEAGIDFLQLLPALLVVHVSGSAPLQVFPVLLAVTAGTLLFVNVIGIWIAAAARSIAEGALFCAVTTLLLLHASGTFRTPSPETVAVDIERLAPFRALHETFVVVATARTTPHGLVTLLVADVIVVALTLLFACALLRALALTDGRG